MTFYDDDEDDGSDFHEPILEDHYPVYPGYLYVADGKVVECPLQGTVAQLKYTLKAKEIRRCDLSKRDLI